MHTAKIIHQETRNVYREHGMKLWSYFNLCPPLAPILYNTKADGNKVNWLYSIGSGHYFTKRPNL